MDFTRFLNSKDIAEYLKKINYEFSPEEALYVIHGSKDRTLAEKREAFGALLAQYPDHKLRERRFGAFKNHTLDSFLGIYFQKQDALIEECRRVDGDAVYSVSTYNMEDGWDRGGRRLFRTFDECPLAVKEEDAEKLEIVKQFFSGRTIALTLLSDGTVLDVETSERDDTVMNAFEMLYVEIPIPFRYGDIVKPVREKVWDAQFHTPYEDAVVLTYIPHWDSEAASGRDAGERWGKDRDAYQNLRKRHLMEGDETDMFYAGYFLTEHGFVCDHSVGDTYLDLEFYRGELSGRGRILTAISLYFQRQIDLETLFAAVRVIEAEATERALRETSLQGLDELMKKIRIGN